MVKRINGSVDVGGKLDSSHVAHVCVLYFHPVSDVLGEALP
jgi:hypothetical protein